MKQPGDQIRFHRERKGLSQRELALKARVGLESIEKYEDGSKIPDTAALMRLSTVLDLPASVLSAAPHSLLDPELRSLILEIGPEKAKAILKKEKKNKK
ncbi:helix-turn-helix domain-containing protein [Bacillus mangrovi]|uniref:Helix-turn-helix domain-containing protein n=1 Tax=Metabacillus mangrovi TaxID=1491830 RepID=A0A7X2S8F7_9BACI|nr:helix-turn-helix transcriptional regulator [Metabacillus mangrovi]MTH55539.1 helix-turn-helix domain-containing protein [Metabacillus mangrovi]